jgi:hypothetical protein
MSRSRSRLAADWFAKLRVRAGTQEVEHEDVEVVDAATTTALAAKADVTYVDTSIGNIDMTAKADVTYVNTALDAKVDDSQVLTNVPSGAVFTDTNTTYSVGDGGLSEINFTSADHSKLNGIEAGATADQTQSDINALGITAVSVDLGNWTVTETAGVLIFATGGVNKAKIDASGNFTVVGDVTAFGTI